MTDTYSILSMTEHAGYVWPCYALAAVLLIGLVVSSLNGLRKTRIELEQAEKNIVRTPQ
ncbi:MAG: heme exporter protein CcmD [Rhodospirillales bacterium]|nr:heme exporter protein CcmD [Rhodospirillales bacterium]